MARKHRSILFSNRPGSPLTVTVNERGRGTRVHRRVTAASRSRLLDVVATWYEQGNAKILGGHYEHE